MVRQRANRVKGRRKSGSRPIPAAAVYIVLGVLIGAAGMFAVNGFLGGSGDGHEVTRADLGPAPEFTLPSTMGGEIALSDFIGDTNVLLYFQEGIMCGACWDQIESIQEEYDQFEALEIEVLTITVDPLNGLVKESEKRGLTLPVLEDADLSVSRSYPGVLENSMHPGSRPGHSFFLVDKAGQMVWGKHYYPKEGGMWMGSSYMSPNGRMDVPVDELLGDVRAAMEGLQAGSDDLHDGEIDHSMCITPIHRHANLRVYVNGTMVDFAKREHMDQSAEFHFHPTVKVDEDDEPGVPVGDFFHIHRDNVTLRDFFATLDLPPEVSAAFDDEAQLQVYVNETLVDLGLDHAPLDGDRVLVTTGPTTDTPIQNQLGSVTRYTSDDEDRYPSLFGGC